MTLQPYHTPDFGDHFMITWDMGANILVLAAEDQEAFIGDARRGMIFKTHQEAQDKLMEMHPNINGNDLDNMSVRQVKEFMEMRYQVALARGTNQICARVLWCLPEEPHSAQIFTDIEEARGELRKLKTLATRWHQDKLTEISRLTL
jgi:hypothetical protein